MPRKKKSLEQVLGEPIPTHVVPPSRDRPVTYETVTQPAILEEIKEYATSGCTMSQIASRLLVSKQTLYTWSKKYPELNAVISEGKKSADDRVEESLYELCFPRDVKEVEVEKDGQGTIIRQKIKTKHYPANPIAIQFWLQNRRKEDWKNQQTMELTGESRFPVQIVYDLDKKEKPDIKTEDKD